MHVISSVVAVIVMCNIALAAGALYLLPVLVGWIRRVPGFGSVAALNVLLGWTIIGWAVALALVLRSARQPGPAVQIVQHLPAPTPPWVPPEVRSWAGRPDLYPYREGCPPPLELPPRPADPGAASWARAPAR